MTLHNRLPYATSVIDDVMAEGDLTHDPSDWKLHSSQFHLGKALRHLGLLFMGDGSEDHAAHALCRIAMWVEMLREEGRR